MLWVPGEETLISVQYSLFLITLSWILCKNMFCTVLVLYPAYYGTVKTAYSEQHSFWIIF